MNCHFESCCFKTDKNKIKTWIKFELLETWSHTTGSAVIGLAKNFTIFELNSKSFWDNTDNLGELKERYSEVQNPQKNLEGKFEYTSMLANMKLCKSFEERNGLWVFGRCYMFCMTRHC